VARLNDADVLLRIDVAKFAFKAAQLEADSEIRVKYTEMQAKVARADWESGMAANAKQTNVVPEMEIRRRRAEYDAGILGIENARHELAIAKANARVKEAELKQAQALMNRIQLKSPITGIVTERLRYEGEYVRPGDPVVRIGQLDRLQIDGLVLFKDLTQREAYGRRVRIRIPVGEDTNGTPIIETFESEIKHVAAEIELNDTYRVWAEFENRGEFIVRPGMIGEMTILD
jgi:multidrug resistance efflux pump